MYERVSFNNLCFVGTTLADDIVTWKNLGAKRVGIFVFKIDAAGWNDGIAMIQDTNLKVATFTHPFMLDAPLDRRDRWDEARERLMRTIDAARTLGAETIYMTTGGRGAFDWEDAAQAFSEAVAPCAAAATEHGIPLLIETANPLYADVHFIHTLKDTLKVARQAGLGVCIDIFACWTESALKETIEEAIPLTHLVQASDYVLGDRALSCRAVPGDGVIPLATIIAQILDTGFDGAFDLELVGPRIVDEGPAQASRRAADWIERFLADYEKRH